jgi:hypothetical protein
MARSEHDKWVQLFRDNQYCVQLPFKSVEGAIEWFTELLQRMPEELRNGEHTSIEIECDSYGEGCGTHTLEVGYWRPETPEEQAERVAEFERKRRLARQVALQAEALQEERDRREYERLKAKYAPMEQSPT